MFTVLCHVIVKPDRVQDFIDASSANARASREEPGCRLFEVIQQQGEPTQFVLVETYDSAADLGVHKTQEHYLTWKAAMEDIQVERHALKYDVVTAEA